MNNFEKIKAMSIEEMAELFVKYPCDDIFCEGCICGDDDCRYQLKQWLETECEE